MKTRNLRRLLGPACLALLAGVLWTLAALAQPVEFAQNGGLKMLYDNRMYPQAVEHGGRVYLVWRGSDGLAYIRFYDLLSREFSDPFMLLTGRIDGVDAAKYKRDHHNSPVIWIDGADRLHVLVGCHSSAGIHLVSEKPGEITRWKRGTQIAVSISYPKFHRIYGGKTLVYFRHSGHLGSWRYRISSDGGETWLEPARTLVDLNAEPRDGALAAHAGSYETTRVSKDGRTLHVAFIWKVEEPVWNRRYGMFLSDHTQRYNLYYLKVDLPSGRAFNATGKELTLPVRKSVADRECLVWDTDERVAAVGPSIYLDEQDRPYFLLPVSDETQYRCHFYFVRRQRDVWKRTAIAPTSHPFNSSHLSRGEDGLFHAYLVTGEGESVGEREMDLYGWGTRIEEWISDASGENWERRREITPRRGLRFQNIQFVRQDAGRVARDMLLFYGWRAGSGAGVGFLWDDRLIGSGG